MRDEKQYLTDIVETAELIHDSVKGVSLEQFSANIILQRAVFFNFAIIGEAANKLSKTTRSRYPEIDWASIIGFRNIIVHAYFSLNILTVWKAAKRRVLPLARQVRSIIKNDFPDPDELNATDN